MARPSHKELFNKLALAKDLISKGEISLIKPHIIVSDALELGYSVEVELQELLLDLIDHTTPNDYVGNRPPQRSYENEITDLELFAFKSQCNFFHGYIYYKFAINDTSLFLVSLHKNIERR